MVRDATGEPSGAPRGRLSLATRVGLAAGSTKSSARRWAKVPTSEFTSVVSTGLPFIVQVSELIFTKSVLEDSFSITIS